MSEKISSYSFINLPDAVIPTCPIFNKSGKYVDKTGSGMSPEETFAIRAGDYMHLLLYEIARRIILEKDLPDFPALENMLNEHESIEPPINLKFGPPLFRSINDAKQIADFAHELIGDPVMYSLYPALLHDFPDDTKEEWKTKWFRVYGRNALIAGILRYILPEFNSDEVLLLPEVAIRPSAKNLKYIHHNLLAPPKVNFTITQDNTRKSDYKFENLHLFRGLETHESLKLLFQILIRQRIPLEFQELIKTYAPLICRAEIIDQQPISRSVLLNLVRDFRELPESTFQNRLGKLHTDKAVSLPEVEKLISVRILLQAQEELRYMFKGRVQINTLDDLQKALNFFGTISDETELKEYAKIITDIASLPIEFLLSSVSGCRPDAILFRGPKEIINTLKKSARHMYEGKRRQPNLLNYPDFIADLTDACREGVICETWDYKTSIGGRIARTSRDEQTMLNIISHALYGVRLREKNVRYIPPNSFLDDPIIKSYRGGFTLYIVYDLADPESLTHLQLVNTFKPPKSQTSETWRAALGYQNLVNFSGLQHLININALPNRENLEAIINYINKRGAI